MDTRKVRPGHRCICELLRQLTIRFPHSTASAGGNGRGGTSRSGCAHSAIPTVRSSTRTRLTCNHVHVLVVAVVEPATVQES